MQFFKINILWSISSYILFFDREGDVGHLTFLDKSEINKTASSAV